MPDALVTTKVRVPRTRTELVPRPRLREALVRYEGRRLTLVSAPAGFGKTTLLSEWLEDHSGDGRSVVWLSLEEADNDPARFLAYLVSALRSDLGEGIGEGVLASLRLPEFPPVEAVVGVLINELADVGHEEATAFLTGVMGLTLSAADVAALEEVTEGWIAALQLAALSMRDREDLSSFVETFSGSNRHVLDFLAEEVLERQPEGMREFLLKTSVPERMSAPLCDALTGRNDGQQMLERLEHDNLFVIALDDERHWYRYHHLFADVLRSRLQREQPERIRELHRRAAAWYERNDWTSEAVRHALAAQENDRAADLVEQVARKMWNRGEVMTLLGWLEALPEETRRRRPQLLLQYSAALLWVGRLDDVEPLVQEIERAVGVSEQGRDEGLRSSADEPLRQALLGGAAATRSWHAYLKGEPHNAIALARRALAILPDKDLELRTFAAFRLAEAHRTADDLEAASAAFAETAELGRAAGHDYLVLRAMSRQAKLHMAQGRLRKADHVLRRALLFAVEQGGDSLPAT